MNPQIINSAETVSLRLQVPSTAKSKQRGGIYVLSGDRLRSSPVGFIVQ